MDSWQLQCLYTYRGRSSRCHKKLIFRCPMPHKLAEAKYPGTVDEKLSSEVGRRSSRGSGELKWYYVGQQAGRGGEALRLTSP